MSMPAPRPCYSGSPVRPGLPHDRFHAVLNRLRSIFNDDATQVPGRVVTLYVLVAAANVGAWGWALLAFRHYPLLLGTALLAFGLGLRHAIDADHIAAIDNVTRKLMQEGKKPVGVG